MPKLPILRPAFRVERVVVTGGRDFDDRVFIYSALNEVLDELGFSYLIEGDAPGLDKIAGLWARQTLGAAGNIKVPADWSNIETTGAVVKTRKDGTAYNALAGHQRNQQMLEEERPDFALVFPGNAGTRDMLGRIEKAGIRHRLIGYPKHYDGIDFTKRYRR